MSKYTPWRYSQQGSEFRVADTGETRVATVQLEADARLLVAAPDLVTALQDIVTRLWTQPGGHFHPTDEDRAMGAPGVCPQCIHDRAVAALKKAGAL